MEERIEKEKKARINQRIRAREVRVIDEAGEQLGILTRDQALSIAQEKGFDLVEVSPNSNPPVCRIMDYGKFLYQESKQAQEARKKQKHIKVKEIKVRPNIDDHDLDFKRNHMIDFLKNGDKVKLTVVLRGREVAHPELGRAIIDRILKELGTVAKIDLPTRREGRNMILILSPA